MLISETQFNTLRTLLDRGQFSHYEFVDAVFKGCVSGAKSLFLDSIANVLPIALTVAGAMVMMFFGGWMFEGLGALAFIGGVVSAAASSFMIPGFAVVAGGAGLICAKIFMKKDAE